MAILTFCYMIYYNYSYLIFSTLPAHEFEHDGGADAQGFAVEVVIGMGADLLPYAASVIHRVVLGIEHIEVFLRRVAGYFPCGSFFIPA